jgi:hypothetical protein
LGTAAAWSGQGAARLAHREEDEFMNAGKTILGALVIAGLAVPAADAHACGGMAMAMPMAAPMAMAAHAMPMPAIGAMVEVLPAGYISVTVNGVAFFRAGPAWYQQYQAPTGVVFQVVPAPQGM